MGLCYCVLFVYHGSWYSARGDRFVPSRRGELEAKHWKVCDSHVHCRHCTDPPEASWDAVTGPKAGLPAKPPLKGRHHSWHTCARVILVPALTTALAVASTRYSILRVTHSDGAWQIQAVKGPPWVMLTPPPSPLWGLAQVPPPLLFTRNLPRVWPAGWLPKGGC